MTRKKLDAFFVSLIILIASILIFVSASLRPPVFSNLRVEGGKIVDEIGREVRLKGFVLWEKVVLYNSTKGGGIEKWGEYTQKDYGIIKQWGFNVIQLFCRWHSLEPDRNNPGSYDENAFRNLENHVQMAANAGLYVLMSMCTHYKDEGPYFADDLLDPFMREQFNNLVRYWVDKFKGYNNVIGFFPLHFPWHGVSATSDARAAYAQTIAPDLVRCVRERTEKIMFIAPMLERPENLWDLSSLTQMDDNLVFSCKFAGGSDADRDWRWNIMGGDFYDGDKERLRGMIKPAYDFSREYNVPIFNPEWKIYIHEPANDQRPIREDRLLFVEHKCQIMDEFGIHWTYWNYGRNAGLGILEDDGTPSTVVDVLKKYNVSSTTDADQGKSSVGRNIGNGLIGLRSNSV